ncbi:ABC transporter permease [Nocardioides albidus]|uniref:ABC transporter permease n=1 Tax=Nocardioides albidus TaxID=1517589 RepID=A0A5C4VLD2_9ACTN|nr:ABC transporter permease [Nocardioides albidus]TNM36653.1 ABC transporter permease [Nocardioides albidus]
MSVWKPARRMARRSIRRNLARSVLIALLIGLPVAVATFSDVLYRSSDSPARTAYLELGSADAKLVVTPNERLRDFVVSSEWDGGYQEGGTRRDPSTVDVAALLPQGTRIEATQNDGGVGLLLRHGTRYDESWLEQTTMPSRFRPDRLQLSEGRFPEAGEIVLARSAAARLRVGAGDVVTDDLTGVELTVSGVVRDESCLRCPGVFAQPGRDLLPTPERPGAPAREFVQPTYLLDLPAGTDPDALARRLADHGVVLFPRDTYLHPEDYRRWDEPVTLDQVRGAALTTLIVGLGLLEVILLAGAAFAVGARKQARDMGLISAGGASPRQLRAVLLVQGATLGVLGTVGGVVVGFAVARLGWPLWEYLNGSVLPVFRFGPEILIAVVVGVLSGVLAAVVPAIGAARKQPLDALSGRFRVTRRRSRRVGIAGGVAVLAGVLLGLAGSAQMADDFHEYAETLASVRRTGTSLMTPSPTIPIALVLAGAVLAIAGLVLAMPVVLGALGRLAARLPLPARLAVRDADRHRHRTGPATSAIMLAVAGSVVAACAIAGTERAEESRWVPQLPLHTMQIYSSYDVGDGQQTADAAARRAAAVLPGAEVLEPAGLGYQTAPSQQDENNAQPLSEIWFNSFEDCSSSCVSYGGGGSAAIADPALVRLTLGRDLTADESAALDRGEVLALSPALVGPDGKVSASLDARVEVRDDGSYSEEDIPKLSLPAHVVKRKTYYGALPSVFMSAETAQRAGLVALPSANMRTLTFSSDATPAQIRAALKAARTGHRTEAWVQQPYQARDRLALLAVGGLAGLVTLIGVAIAVALSAAEGRRELATLSAVGADPAVRRRLAGAQALVIAGVGALVGVVLGISVSYALRATFGAPSFTVPWANLAGVGLGVPVLAALITAACTRSRVPMLERRA